MTNAMSTLFAAVLAVVLTAGSIEAIVTVPAPVFALSSVTTLA